MIDKTENIKEKVLSFMEQEVSKYGNARMDVKEIGELADVVKDLAEAEYYCAVSKAMADGGQESYGYTQPSGMGNRAGYGGFGGGMANERQGYTMDHSDPVSALRDMFATSDPETRMMLRNEVSKLMM